jgi:hypothetical protein
MTTESQTSLTTIVRAGVERCCQDFTAQIAPLGFARTKKMIWTRRHPLIVEFIHLHRGGSSYGAPANASVDLRVHFGIRVLNDDFEAAALNGRQPDFARMGASAFQPFYAGIFQTIDGEFVGFAQGLEVCRLLAVDSSYWEVTGSPAFEATMLRRYGPYR